jgi:hypothetical protein
MAALDSSVSVGITVWTSQLQMYILIHIIKLITSGRRPELPNQSFTV